MNRYQRLLGLFGWLVWLGLWVLPGSVFAHGGEDHGDAKIAAAAPSARPRLEASSPDFQIVAILHDQVLAFYLDRYATNEPVLNARMTVESDGQSQSAVAGADGAYPVNAIAAWTTPGIHEVIATVDAEGVSDILIGNLVIPSPPAIAPAPASHVGWRWLEWLGAGAGGLLLGLLLGRRGPATAVALLPLLLGLSLPSPPALAHGGALEPAARGLLGHADDGGERLEAGRRRVGGGGRLCPLRRGGYPRHRLGERKCHHR